MAVLLVMLPVLVALGGVSAHLAARRHPRDELRIESETRTPRPASRSDFFALLRVDRASVWRVVPMRRGIMVLAIGPGLVGVAGGLDWPQLTILPGLVASGGALLFGVNAWCLEARGVLWRESLPVNPATVFDARVVVLMEFLLLSSGFTILLASLRAGVPSAQELAAILSHLARGDHAGGLGLDALVGQATVRRRPALGPGDPRAAGGDGGLLRPGSR